MSPSYGSPLNRGYFFACRISSIMNSIYPVGSLYFGTQSTCPLQSAGIGTWTRIATNFVTGSTAPVYGTGKGLILSSNSTSGTMHAHGDYGSLSYSSTIFNQNIGTYLGSGNTIIPTYTACGLATKEDIPEGDAGIVADLPTYTVNVWRRTA